MITLDVRALALRLENAYSTDRYRNGWSGCVRMLLKRGYNEAQIEAIIRSKWTRWAADGSAKRYGQVTSADLARFLDTDRGATLEAVNQMVAESAEEPEDIDPTPWCGGCGAMRKDDCHCGPIAANE